MKPCRPRRARPVASPEARVRPAAVARARRLLADPGYPPPAVLRAVARRLAGRLAAETPAGNPSPRGAA